MLWMKNYVVREKIPEEVDKALSMYPELMRTLLYYRDIKTPEEAHHFLNPDFLEHVHDPYLLKDMNKAVKRILKAVEDGEKILIYSDYDADGIPAAVVMHDFFKLIGYSNFEIYIPHRHHEGFGLHLEAVEKFKEQGVTLLITLDCGITDVEEVARAKELGIDVIVTDHHLPATALPPAYAIVNPKQEDCNYPFDMLCGSGVAFKLVQGVLMKMRKVGLPEESSFVSQAESRMSPPSGLHTSDDLEKKISENNFENQSNEAHGEEDNRATAALRHEARLSSEPPASGQEKWLLDMVGLATLSDMVPLKGENRVFAQYGLKVLRKSRRPGLQKLLGMLKMDQRYLTEDDVGFMITPRINAASRMGIPTDAFKLLSETDEVVAGSYAEHLNTINNERKGLVASLVKEIRKTLEERRDHYQSQQIIVLGNPAWRPALLGLAANTIAEEFGKPVFLWGREDGKLIKGSCRSDGVRDLVKIMQGAREAFVDFGGHKFSGGFSVDHEKIHTLEEALAKSCDGIVVEDPNNIIADYIDAELSLDDINNQLFNHIDTLAPFGMANPKPLFLFKNATPENVKMFGKTQEHLELSFSNMRGKTVKAIGFFMKPEDFETIPQTGKPMNLIGTLEKSMFRNFPELRLRIVDIF
jgi:single-stranded-DNA-specific exonuclease